MFHLICALKFIAFKSDLLPLVINDSWKNNESLTAGNYDQKNLFPVCNCSPHGSVRSDCEQMSGKCICKPGISGDKCDTCPDGTSVTLKGCEGCKFQFKVTN